MYSSGPGQRELCSLTPQLYGASHLTVAAPPGRKLDLISRLAADEVIPIDRNDPCRHREHLLATHPYGFDW